MADHATSQTSNSPCSGPSCCCGSNAPKAARKNKMDRRTFLRVASAAAAAAAAPFGSACAGASPTIDHFVPVEKKLSPAWIRSLFARGARQFYQGKDLDTIGMPCGGLCAGQVYLTGDGKLAYWEIFNQQDFSGYGAKNYALGLTPKRPVDQGFALRVSSGGRAVIRSLDKQGFPGVRFCGEYPICTVEYKDASLPVDVTLEAYSPFIPLNAADSALPATVMQYTIKNTSDKPVEATIAGWLQNAVSPHSSKELFGVRSFKKVTGPGYTSLLGSAKPTAPPKDAKPPQVLADFEGGNYGDWKVQGDAFGKAPAQGTLDKQQEVSGFQGKGLVNTYLGGDDKLTGRLTSPTFRIDRPFISFLIGGGSHKDKTCINLVVDGKTVRTAVGKNDEKLLWNNWNVGDLQGKQAHLEIVDAETSGWGHINIDQIELGDAPRAGSGGKLEDKPDFGTMALSILGQGDPLASTSLPEGELPANLFDGSSLAEDDKKEKTFYQLSRGGLGRTVTIAPGGSQQITFVISWCFPNRPEADRGNYYTNRFGSAAEVAAYIAGNFDRLTSQTRLWRDTYFDSTLPVWLLDRLHSTVSTLATGTCQWWKNGRFWAWEGVGCCHGTCTHVWNYEHALARLFPELERSAREMQDFAVGAGFEPDTGMIRFRGAGWGMWATDGQAGSILKAYREHQTSTDSAFLTRNWPHIRKALEFLINEDGNDDGVIEGKQHNTFDIEFYGPNPMIASLYLAALRAAEEMAGEMKDDAFAKKCRKLYESGRKHNTEKLFNGEYFIQIVDLEKHPDAQYGDGCLSDQIFGQGWAHQVHLGYIYPENMIDSTLKAIWKYNWAPDVGPQNEAHKPERWFASPGEGGLFTCTWPRSKHMGRKSVRYRDEVWTGIEYQVAGNMAWEGMILETLAICRAIHERYHPSKHNPWNEIECGDHYARGLASWGVLIGLSGFEYHGPRGYLAFAPRLSAKNFRSVFTAAQGWGSIQQNRQGDTQTNAIELKWGTLTLNSLAFELPEGAAMKKTTLTAAGKDISAQAKQNGIRVELTLTNSLTLNAGQDLKVTITT